MIGTIAWISAIIIGIILLVLSGDKLSDKIVEVAEKAGVSPLVISIVLISLATTLPELTTSALASYEGSNGIALGNALGSMFANIALVLGLAAVIKPLKANKEAFGNSIIMLASLGLVILLSLDGELSRVDGLILLGSYALYLWWLFRGHVSPDVESRESTGKATLLDYVLLLLLGSVLVMGAKLAVYGGENIARAMGVSGFIIGATIVAVGTSLPELTNALYGAIRGRGDISVGNIIGADIMNALVVLGLASLIHPLRTAASVLTILFVVSVMVPMVISLKRTSRISRALGVYFLAVYSLYLTLLFMGVEL